MKYIPLLTFISNFDVLNRLFSTVIFTAIIIAQKELILSTKILHYKLAYEI